MRYLFIGDIHLKIKEVLSGIDKLCKDKEFDKIVFLGDYVDCYDRNKMENVLELLDFLTNWKEKHPNAVMLLGNHDYSYLNEFTSCSGHDYDKQYEIREKLLKLGVQGSFVAGNYLVCHAGVSKSFYDKYMKDVDADPLALSKCINEHLKDDLISLEKDGGVSRFFDVVSAYRGGWDTCGSPTWCDSRELKPVCNQIIGHTPIAEPTREKVNGFDLWEIDCIDQSNKVLAMQIEKDSEPEFEVLELI